MQGNIEEIENMGSMGRRGNIIGCDADLWQIYEGMEPIKSQQNLI